MEERRDKEYIIEVTADKEQRQQAILRIAVATGIETEQIEECIAKLESYGILTEKRSIYIDTKDTFKKISEITSAQRCWRLKGTTAQPTSSRRSWSISDRISSVASMPTGSLCQERLQRQSHGAGTE